MGMHNKETDMRELSVWTYAYTRNINKLRMRSSLEILSYIVYKSFIQQVRFQI